MIDRKNLNDNELVQKYLNGDYASLEFLISRYKDKIFTYILFTVKNHHLAEDIFQDTFIKVVRSLNMGKYTDNGKFVSWVMRIAHNATIDHIRKQKRFVDVTSSYDKESKTDFYDRLPDEDSMAQDEKLELDESTSSLLKHISNLPEEQRTVVMLRHYYEMPFKEIAELTDVSINTALGRMRYALINLRKMFDEEHEKESNSV